MPEQPPKPPEDGFISRLMNAYVYGQKKPDPTQANPFIAAQGVQDIVDERKNKMDEILRKAQGGQ